MLRLCGTLLAALLLVACSERTPQVEPAMQIEAHYELLYNDTPVGSALFLLDIGDDGNYRLEAFTVPAGKMLQQGAHEVLEASQGRLSEDTILPTTFSRSVMQGESLELASMDFDWQAYAMRVRGPQGQRSVGLLPDTHDRLSYLLAARRLAASGEGAALIQVASLEASEQSSLEVDGREVIVVPLGHFDAVALRRVTPDGGETRRLWYAPETSPLPLRVVQTRDGNTVEMRVKDVSRR